MVDPLSLGPLVGSSRNDVGGCFRIFRPDPVIPNVATWLKAPFCPSVVYFGASFPASLLGEIDDILLRHFLITVPARAPVKEKQIWIESYKNVEILFENFYYKFKLRCSFEL